MSRAPTSTAPSSCRVARKGAVAVLGCSVLAFGVILIVLPGPSVLVIPLGLAILATEFLWARKLLDPTRKLLRWLKARVTPMFGKRARPTGRKAQP
jgi:tellurite resistance protein TerC